MTRAISLTLLSLALFCALATSLWAQTPWIHVEVHDAGAEDAHVKVNLPLSVVEIAAEVAPEKFLSHGRFDLDGLDHDIDVEHLRRMWHELRDVGDADLVSVESNEETVTIRREGDHVIVDVDEVQDGEKVHIRVPVTVVDALLSGEGDELDVRAAIAELKKSHDGEVVSVDDGDTKVRVWIDERD